MPDCNHLRDIHAAHVDKKKLQYFLCPPGREMDVSKLTEKQTNALNQFRDVLKDCELHDSRDEYLLQWLVARNFDVPQAEKMIRHSLEWRKVNQVTSILDTWKPSEVIRKYFPFGYSGHDKFGCPVWINPFGRTDMKGLLESVGKRDYLRHVVYLNEFCCREMKQLSVKFGRPIMQETVIFDMKHVSWKMITQKAVMEIGVEVTKLTEAHYPEYLRKVFIVNAPTIFPLIFAIVKPFMQPATISKIEIFSNDQEAWKAALLKEIDADQLPAYYGGAMTDPDGDPKCLSKVCYGGQVPKSFYLTSQKPEPLEGMETATISKGTKKKIQVDVKRVNSILKWEFMSEGGDVAFHVYYKDGDDKVDVFPWDRVDCDVVMEKYQVTCTRATTYFVEFDNSFSYVRSKKVWYSVQLEEPAA